MGVIITFYTFLLIDRLMVGRDIFTCYSIKDRKGVRYTVIVTVGLVSWIGLLLLLWDAACLLHTCCVSSRRLLLTVSSPLSGATATPDSLSCLTRRLVSHLMIVHPHQLINQVAELSRVPIHLVPASPAHGRLLILELLLQYYNF